jgi:hypothetical protein
VLVAITIVWPEGMTYWLVSRTDIDSQHVDHRPATAHCAGGRAVQV